MRMETEEKVVYYFDDLSSIANHQISPVNKDVWERYINSSHGNQEGWLGMPRAQLREAIELRGWQEGVDRGLKLLGHIQAPKLPTYKRKRCHKTSGHSVNMQRVYNGREKFWRSSEKEQSNNKLAKKGHVTIFITVNGTTDKRGDSFFWNGALGCVWAKSLIESGRKVRILCGGQSKQCFNENNKRLVYITQCKRYDQPLDLHNLFSMTALAGFHRHYQFKVIAGAGYSIAGQSFGCSIDIDENDIADLLDDEPCILIENIHSLGDAERKAAELIKEMGT